MTAHEARAIRTRDQWRLWSAACPCGWSSQALGKQDAEQRAFIHQSVKEALAVIEAEVPEACYDEVGMEYGPEYPCLRCTLRGLLGRVA